MATGEENRIIARGLNPPGPLMLVKKRIDEFRGGHLRVIVSSEDAADELVDYFMVLYYKLLVILTNSYNHVVVDLTEFGEEA